MSYAFGWWDFETINGEEQMICRDSDERVVKVGDLPEPWLGKACAEHPKRPTDRWMRFEYRHEEFWFPLIVNWVPEEGRILVDYNLSSELWRQETNADTEYPPYGGWVRVDDMVPDAFWCWPGVFFKKNFSKKEFNKNDWGIFLVGKWYSGDWDIERCSRECSYMFSWEACFGAYSRAEAEPYTYGHEIVTRYIKDHIFQLSHPFCSLQVGSIFKVDSGDIGANLDFTRNFDLPVESTAPFGWQFVFDTTENAQALLSSLGGRLILDHFSSADSDDLSLGKYPDHRPYLFRSDGKAVITISGDYEVDVQTLKFSFFLEDEEKLKGYEFGCSSMLINQASYRNDRLGIFLELVEAEFDLDASGRFSPKAGRHAVGSGWGGDLHISHLPRLMREVKDAMQEWQGINYHLLSVDLPLILSADEFANTSRLLGSKLGKYRYLLGYEKLYQMMGVLAGAGCRHRHRELGIVSNMLQDGGTL